MAEGVDLLQITGVGINTLLTMMTEVGFDMSKFKISKAFCFLAWFCT